MTRRHYTLTVPTRLLGLLHDVAVAEGGAAEIVAVWACNDGFAVLLRFPEHIERAAVVSRFIDLLGCDCIRVGS